MRYHSSFPAVVHLRSVSPLKSLRGQKWVSEIELYSISSIVKSLWGRKNPTPTPPTLEVCSLADTWMPPCGSRPTQPPRDRGCGARHGFKGKKGEKKFKRRVFFFSPAIHKI